MTILLALFALYVLSAVMGRILRHEHVVAYIMLIVLAVIQVGIAVFEMFRMEPPRF